MEIKIWRKQIEKNCLSNNRNRQEKTVVNSEKSITFNGIHDLKKMYSAKMHK